MENNCKSCGNELSFVLFTMKNNAKRVRKQCLNCGESDSKIYKHSIFKNIFELPLYNVDLNKSFIKNCFNRRYLKKEIGSKDYYNNVYLKSNEWALKRQNILLRDNHKCVCCDEKATQVHHITYSHVYQEKEKHLLSVCNNCHHKIHFGENVFFRGLSALYGELNVCQNCNSYNNNANKLLCNSCKI